MRIDVLGLGESISDYYPSSNTAIGVNDINKHINVDYIVCVDLPEKFDKKRLATILKARPKKFFSHLDIWHPLVCNFQKIKLDKFPGCLDGLDNKELVCYSNNSAYVAVVIAYKMGAKEIVMYGVDLKTHAHLGTGNIAHNRAIEHFKNLFLKLKKKGVNLFVSSSISELAKFIPIYGSESLHEYL